MNKKMRSIFAVAAIVMIALSSSALLFAGDVIIFDTLAGSKIGAFPKLWRTWPFQRDTAATVYSAAEENGKRFIKAYDDHDASVQIFYNFNWEINNRPMLSWRWRATALPAGANESNDATNDSACGLYVVIGRYDGHAIKYVWSTTLAPGTVVTRRDGKLKIKVLDSGSKNLSKWVAHSVDVAKDYEELFGSKLEKNPGGIGLLTDGNATHKPAGCDYTEFGYASR